MEDFDRHCTSVLLSHDPEQLVTGGHAENAEVKRSLIVRRFVTASLSLSHSLSHSLSLSLSLPPSPYLSLITLATPVYYILLIYYITVKKKRTMNFISLLMKTQQLSILNLPLSERY